MAAARYHPVYNEDDDPDTLLLPTNASSNDKPIGPSQRRSMRASSLVPCGPAARRQRRSKPLSSSSSSSRRWLKRPSCGFLTIWLCFVFFLTILWTLFSKERQPTSGGAEWIGWQAYEDVGGSKYDFSSSPIDDAAIESTTTTTTTATGGAIAGPAFPLDIFAPLVPNPSPLTEITVENCTPLRLKTCHPPTTPEEDALLGKWVLMPRPLDSEIAQSLNWGKTGAMGSALDKIFGALDTRYFFYRRSRRNDVPRIIDLRLVEVGRQAPTGGEEEGWYRVKHDLRTKYMRLWGGAKGLHLYYRLDRPRTQESSPLKAVDESWDRRWGTGSKEPITELEIMYGDASKPWPSFEVVGQIMPTARALGRSSTYLTARRKPVPLPSVDVHPKFKSDSTYKILQIADLHFSVNEEPCRQVSWESPNRPCRSFNDTVALMHKWLDTEKPDLVVLTGDQINGQTTSWDPKSILPGLIEPMVQRKIHWAALLGNHDSESGPLTRPEVQLLFSRLPYSLSRLGPSYLHEGVGAGNYYIRLQSPGPEKSTIFSLYFFDSGMNAPKSLWESPWRKAYDWIRKDQVEWFLEQSGKVKKILRPFKPDGEVDLAAQNWKKEEDDKAVKVWDAGSAQGSTLSKPNALAFVHIPLPEFFIEGTNIIQDSKLIYGPDRAETSGKKGSQREPGLYDAIWRQGQRGDQDVRGVVSGHMHNNGDCRKSEKKIDDGNHKFRANPIWTCYGGGSSFAGYGMNGIDRQSRVFDITNFGETVTTWNRMEDGSKKYEGVLWDDMH